MPPKSSKPGKVRFGGTVRPRGRRRKALEFEEAENPPPTNGPTILFVDDDPDMLRLAVLTFREHMPKANVVTAKDGLQGTLKLFELKPDILVCDLKLPGTNGFELCQLVRMDHRLRGKVKTIAITGQHSPETRARALRDGADDYLAKPFEPTDLLKTIASLMPADKDGGGAAVVDEDEEPADSGVRELGEPEDEEAPYVPQEEEL